MRSESPELIIGAFFQGPYDGKRILLPTSKPWKRFVIPEFGTVQLEFFYLLAGALDEMTFAYLFDDTFAGISNDHDADS